MDLVNCEINKFVLLTGAGFTHNFGGFLAKGMWESIFNYLDENRHLSLRKELKNDFDYESVYYKVVERDKFNENEKQALSEAVFSAYKNLDDKIRGYRSLGVKQPVSIAAVKKFVNRFDGIPSVTGRNGTKGFFFTLNQDLLIERYLGGSNMPALYVNQPTIEVCQDKEYQESTCSLILPLQKDLEKNNGLSSSKYFYVKLHGSMNWYSSDGTKKLVIGRNKIKQINEDPVLKNYFELFKKALSSQDIKLFIIGYGFGDEHVNKVISDSMAQNNLNLFMLNPIAPENFKSDLHTKPLGRKIWDGISKYYPYSLEQVFPNDETNEYKRIRKDFFGN
ncbi:MAG: SIR2 family protein [Nitrospirota bacterium]